jgi:hypothetical protein
MACNVLNQPAAVRLGAEAQLTGCGRLHELAEVGFSAAEFQWPDFYFELELFKAHSRPNPDMPLQISGHSKVAVSILRHISHHSYGASATIAH